MVRTFVRRLIALAVIVGVAVAGSTSAAQASPIRGGAHSTHPVQSGATCGHDTDWWW